MIEVLCDFSNVFSTYLPKYKKNNDLTCFKNKSYFIINNHGEQASPLVAIRTPLIPSAAWLTHALITRASCVPKGGGGHVCVEIEVTSAVTSLAEMKSTLPAEESPLQTAEILALLLLDVVLVDEASRARTPRARTAKASDMFSCM